MDTQAHQPILRRIGWVLIIFGGIHALTIIADTMIDGTHSYTIDALSLLLGALLLNHSLGAARFLAFITGWSVAGILSSVLVLPPVFLMIFPGWMWKHIPFAEGMLALASLVFMLAIELLIGLWILRELRRPEVAHALAQANKRPLKGLIWWGAGISSGLALLLGVIFFSLAPTFKAMFSLAETQAIVQAREQLGDGYEYTVTDLQTENKTWRAHVVAKRGADVKELDLEGTATP